MGTCAAGFVRRCTGEGFVGCACPPGARQKGSGCELDPAAKVPACVVADTTLGRTLSAFLEFGRLEMPPLPTVDTKAATAAIEAIDGREEGAGDAALLAAAEGWETAEGVAAYAAQSAIGPKAKERRAARDRAVARAIELRRSFLARFPGHPRDADARVALARALLRRAAYVSVGDSVAKDRTAARGLLEGVVAQGPIGRPFRDASFVIGEQAARDRDLGLLARSAEAVLRISSAKLFADDHAFLAAGHARLAQARLEAGDLEGARRALEGAIHVGVTCSPRAECVSAVAGARRILAATWAASGAPARSAVPLLSSGASPRHERVRPLLELAELTGAAPGEGCREAAEEARAWAQTIR